MRRLFFIACILLACKGNPNQMGKVATEENDSITSKAMRDSTLKMEEDEAIKNGKYKSYWRYSFHIRGDFDGDGKKEELAEKLISRRTEQEVAPLLGFEEDTVPDCWWTATVNKFRMVKCVLESSNPGIVAFVLTGESENQSIGLDFLQNEGDLDGNGTDEIMYVLDYGGCNSAVRTGKLATYSKGKWKVLTEFECRLDDYPETGLEFLRKSPERNDPAIKTMDREMAEFPKWFKKQNGKIFYQVFEPEKSDVITQKELKIN